MCRITVNEHTFEIFFNMNPGSKKQSLLRCRLNFLPFCSLFVVLSR